jgi:hypothetical protein
MVAIDRREWDRHAWTRHQISKPGQITKICKYGCICGHETGRKDNYRRHLKYRKGCGKTAIYSHYRCECGLEGTNLGDHYDHIDACGNGKPGRPRKAA